MSWIKRILPDEAGEALKAIYRRVKRPDGGVDNILTAHSLRPRTLEGHMALYKNVLHSTDNTVPKWFLEAIGLYVSRLNACEYCVEHHFTGMRRLLDDDRRAFAIRGAVEADDPAAAFSGKELAAMFYARALTRAPSELSEETIQNMREAGWDDGEILEINQVAAYFAYANRTVLGLGVDLAGEPLGTSPEAEDSDDWSHS